MVLLVCLVKADWALAVYVKKEGVSWPLAPPTGAPLSFLDANCCSCGTWTKEELWYPAVAIVAHFASFSLEFYLVGEFLFNFCICATILSLLKLVL